MDDTGKLRWPRRHGGKISAEASQRRHLELVTDQWLAEHPGRGVVVPLAGALGRRTTAGRGRGSAPQPDPASPRTR